MKIGACLSARPSLGGGRAAANTQAELGDGVVGGVFMADNNICVCVWSTGMGWKVTMLVLSSLALVLGAVILIVNVHHNR